MTDLITEIVAEARKKWPDATRFVIESSMVRYFSEGGSESAPWKLIYYHLDCDGDELGSSMTANTAEALLVKLRTTDAP